MLRKLLLSMVCLICIPLILIQLFTIRKSTVEFTEAQHTQTLSFLQSINAAFDEHIESLSSYSLKIGGVEELKYPLQENLNEYKLYVAASKLKEFNAVYPLINYVGIYYPSTDRVVCNGFCYRLSDFVSLYYAKNTDGSIALSDFFTGAEGLSFFSSDEYQKRKLSQLLIAKSVPIGGGISENAIVFFAIDSADLANWCGSFLSQSSGFAIYSTDDEHLLHSGVMRPELLSSKEYAEFAADMSQTIFSLNDKDDTLIYKYQSPASDYAIFAAMPQNVINENVNRYMWQVRATLIFTFLVTIAFTILTAYINYKPIAQLLRKHVTPALENSKISELDLLDSAFFLRDEQISNQDNLIVTFLVSDILSGDHVDPDEVEKYFPSSATLYFAVSLTDITFTTAQTNVMIERAMQMYGIDLLITTIPKRKETIFVIYSEEKKSFDDRENKLNQVMLSAIGSECGFVSGSVVECAGDVVKSYQEAVQNYYKITESSRIEEPYPTQQIQEFGKNVRRNNTEDALQILAQVRSILPRFSVPYQKFLGFDMVRAYVNNVSEDSIDDMEYMLSIENVPLIFAVLESTLKKRQCVTDAPGKDVNKEIKALLLDYVNSNCLDSTLCLTSAADYMKTSIYTVSRLFKEVTGMGFKDYITSKRLQHACHLLETTNQSVTSIASECGFDNTTYFSTIFKAEYGMTPSKYRTSR